MFPYKLSSFEQWIRQLYASLDIASPDQLEIVNIASGLNVWLYFEDMRSQAIDRGGLYSLVIDRRLPSDRQWEEFGHEMCHLLRQAGNQLLLPDPVVEFQEMKANHFAYHFCVPTFMLLGAELPDNPGQAVRHVASTFHVTPEFAEQRLTRFQRQLLSQQCEDRLQSSLEAQENFRRKSGIDYLIRTGESTMLYCRERGVIGYVKGGSDHES